MAEEDDEYEIIENEEDGDMVPNRGNEGAAGGYFSQTIDVDVDVYQEPTLKNGLALVKRGFFVGSDRSLLEEMSSYSHSSMIASSATYGLVVMVGADVDGFVYRIADVESALEETERGLLSKAAQHDLKDAAVKAKTFVRLKNPTQELFLQAFVGGENGNLVVCVTAETKQAILFDLSKGDGQVCSHTFVVESKGISLVAFQKGLLVYVCAEQGTDLQITNLLTKSTSSAHLDKTITCVGVLSNGSYAACGLEDSTIVAVNLQNPSQTFTLNNPEAVKPEASPTCLYWPQMEHMLVGYGHDCVIVYDLPKDGPSAGTFVQEFILNDPCDAPGQPPKWSHQWFVQYFAPWRVFIVASNWSNVISLIGWYEAEDEETGAYTGWAVWSLIRNGNENDHSSKCEVLDRSVFGLSDRPWIEAQGRDTFEDRVFVSGMSLNVSIHRSVHPWFVLGDNKELEGKADYAPPPTLLTVNSNGLVQAIALVDRDPEAQPLAELNTFKQLQITPAASGPPSIVSEKKEPASILKKEADVAKPLSNPAESSVTGGLSGLSVAQPPNSASGGGLFGRTVDQPPSSAGVLFGRPDAQPSISGASGLFPPQPQPSGSAPGLFLPQPQPSGSAPGLFLAPQPHPSGSAPGLFLAPQSQASSGAPGLFLAPQSQASSGPSGLFLAPQPQSGSASQASSGASGLSFGPQPQRFPQPSGGGIGFLGSQQPLFGTSIGSSNKSGDGLFSLPSSQQPLFPSTVPKQSSSGTESSVFPKNSENVPTTPAKDNLGVNAGTKKGPEAAVKPISFGGELPSAPLQKTKVAGSPKTKKTSDADKKQSETPLQPSGKKDASTTEGRTPKASSLTLNDLQKREESTDQLSKALAETLKLKHDLEEKNKSLNETEARKKRAEELKRASQAPGAHETLLPATLRPLSLDISGPPRKEPEMPLPPPREQGKELLTLMTELNNNVAWSDEVMSSWFRSDNELDQAMREHYHLFLEGLDLQRAQEEALQETEHLKNVFSEFDDESILRVFGLIEEARAMLAGDGQSTDKGTLLSSDVSLQSRLESLIKTLEDQLRRLQRELSKHSFAAQYRQQQMDLLSEEEEHELHWRRAQQLCERAHQVVQMLEGFNRRLLTARRVEQQRQSSQQSSDLDLLTLMLSRSTLGHPAAAAPMGTSSTSFMGTSDEDSFEIPDFPVANEITQWPLERVEVNLPYKTMMDRQRERARLESQKEQNQLKQTIERVREEYISSASKLEQRKREDREGLQRRVEKAASSPRPSLATPSSALKPMTPGVKLSQPPPAPQLTSLTPSTSAQAPFSMGGGGGGGGLFGGSGPSAGAQLEPIKEETKGGEFSLGDLGETGKRKQLGAQESSAFGTAAPLGTATTEKTAGLSLPFSLKPSGSPVSSKGETKPFDLGAALTEFYNAVDPSKASADKIQKLVSKYQVNHEELMNKLKETYSEAKYPNNPTVAGALNSLLSKASASSPPAVTTTTTPFGSTSSTFGFGAKPASSAGVPFSIPTSSAASTPARTSAGEGFASTSTPATMGGGFGFGMNPSASPGTGGGLGAALLSAAGGPNISSPSSKVQEVLIKFYQQVKPEKLASVPNTVQKYQGKEAELWSSLRKVYPAADQLLTRLLAEAGITAGPSTATPFGGGVSGGGFGSFASQPQSGVGGGGFAGLATTTPGGFGGGGFGQPQGNVFGGSPNNMGGGGGFASNVGGGGGFGGASATGATSGFGAVATSSPGVFGGAPGGGFGGAPGGGPGGFGGAPGGGVSAFGGAPSSGASGFGGFGGASGGGFGGASGGGFGGAVSSGGFGGFGSSPAGGAIGGGNMFGGNDAFTKRRG